MYSALVRKDIHSMAKQTLAKYAGSSKDNVSSFFDRIHTKRHRIETSQHPTLAMVLCKAMKDLYWTNPALGREIGEYMRSLFDLEILVANSYQPLIWNKLASQRGGRWLKDEVMKYSVMCDGTHEIEDRTFWAHDAQPLPDAE